MNDPLVWTHRIDDISLVQGKPMRCANCNAEMENGYVRLNGRGTSWLPFPRSTAQLTFNADVVIESGPAATTDLQGTRYPAFRCRACRMISFEYVLLVKAEEPVAIPAVQPVPSTGNA